MLFHIWEVTGSNPDESFFSFFLKYFYIFTIGKWQDTLNYIVTTCFHTIAFYYSLIMLTLDTTQSE